MIRMLKVCMKSASKFVEESPWRVTEHVEITAMQKVHEQKIVASWETVTKKGYIHLTCFPFSLAPIYGTCRDRVVG